MNFACRAGRIAMSLAQVRYVRRTDPGMYAEFPKVPPSTHRSPRVWSTTRSTERHRGADREHDLGDRIGSV
jgi:hypothetical protein